MAADVDVAFVSDGMFNGPKGVRGGEAGGCSRQYKRSRDGTLAEVDQVNVLRLRSDETLVSITTGGGGYGEPQERDKALVQHDVDEGWISLERAQSVYGL